MHPPAESRASTTATLAPFALNLTMQHEARLLGVLSAGYGGHACRGEGSEYGLRRPQNCGLL